MLESVIHGAACPELEVHNFQNAKERSQLDWRNFLLNSSFNDHRTRRTPPHRRRLSPWVAWQAGPLLCLLAIASGARAQDNYEIQVYGSETIPAHHTMLEFHTNFTAQGEKNVVDGVQPTYHALHETIEITHGFTPWFETGFYIFTSARSGDGWDFVGSHLRPRVRVPESWHWPVGVSLSQEIGYQRRGFSADTWTWEIRPIIDKKMGPWYWSFNPAFDRSLHGANVHKGFEFAPNFKLSYDVTRKVAAGIEYYGSLGSITGFDPLRDQQHAIFPTIDLDLAPQWEVNFGAGIGMTGSTDRLVLKFIIGYRFDF